VARSANSTIGSEIDGALAKDPLIAWARREFDARGHSGTPPKVDFKRAMFQNQPVQVAFPGGGQAPRIRDAKSRRYLSSDEIDGKQVEIRMRFNQFSRIRFAAKVALSAGFYALGDYFREDVAHGDARRRMYATNNEEFKAITSDNPTLVHDAFMPVKEGDRVPHSVISSSCNCLRGSVVLIVPGPANVVISVGVLGNYVGSINMPADTTKFSWTVDYDIGHCLVVVDRQLEIVSFRDYLASYAAKLESLRLMSGTSPTPLTQKPPLRVFPSEN
jgi:hypothetical protein